MTIFLGKIYAYLTVRNKNLLFIAFLLLNGCITAHGPNYSFPKDLESQAFIEKQNAKDCIISKGVKLYDRKKDIAIEKIPGTKKYPEGWGFISPEWGQYVLATTEKKGNGYLIKIACNPKTMGDINLKTLRHEFGHYWLMSNYNDYYHDPKFKTCFDGWREMPSSSASFVCTNSMIILDLPSE